MLCGKPLICWTIEQALECDFIDHVIVSTDDNDILKICTQYFKQYKERIIVSPRPEYLALDNTPIEDVIKHELILYPINSTVILLQPTSPLRTSEDIKRAYLMLKNDHTYNLYSVFQKNLLHFKLNGAIYIFILSYINAGEKISDGIFKLIYIMPKERSIDIDTQEDFDQCERYLNNLYK